MHRTHTRDLSLAKVDEYARKQLKPIERYLWDGEMNVVMWNEGEK